MDVSEGKMQTIWRRDGASCLQCSAARSLAWCCPQKGSRCCVGSRLSQGTELQHRPTSDGTPSPVSVACAECCAQDSSWVCAGAAVRKAIDGNGSNWLLVPVLFCFVPPSSEHLKWLQNV